MTTPDLTPAEHRALAEKDLDALRTLTPGTAAYSGRALAAIAHALCAVAEYLEPPPAPDIPGLPLGWGLATEQSGTGMWGYVLTIPDGRRWSSSGAALVAGLRAADLLAAEMGAGDYTSEECAPELRDDPRED
jgi:hypothetical protein